ncbi:MAG: hypothetical protein OEZ58_20205 [Gammaproteobacteria bacterium]|nr:hypothetical protein [Gammaproteobacteria bacterium]MDH5731315.1 hypothetical protein [Gammaproteobacteria bacterium]
MRWLLVILLFVMAISACTFIDSRHWAPYSVNIKVLDQENHIIVHATVKTTRGQTVLTNDKGVAQLFYTNTGLHVVTISAPARATQQLKVSIPEDNEKQFPVIMENQETTLIGEPMEQFVDKDQ